MYGQAQEVLYEALKRVRSTREYADLKLFCGDQTFHVHKVVVCTRSAFFQTACNWGKEGDIKNEIDVGDEDPRLVGLMVDYLYLLEYTDDLPIPVPVTDSSLVDQPAMTRSDAPELFLDAGTDMRTRALPERSSLEEVAPVEDDDGWAFGWAANKTSKKDRKDKKSKKLGKKANKKIFLPRIDQNLLIDRLTLNAKMYVLADKYGIPDLKLLARHKFEVAANKDWKSKEFVQAAALVFENTLSSDEGLRSIIAGIIIAHPELVHYYEVANLLESGNGIAWKVLRSLWSEKQPESEIA